MKLAPVAAASAGSCNAGTALPARQSVPAPAVVPGAGLRFVLVGFDISERLLIEAAVERAQRQSSRWQQLEPTYSAEADVVVIDGRDSCAVAWAGRQPGLARQTVVWVDAAAAPPGQLAANRPAPWAALPALLAQALRHSTAVHLAQTLQAPASLPLDALGS